MVAIPQMILNRFYEPGSLAQTESGLVFVSKNVLGPAQILGVLSAQINQQPVAPEQINLVVLGATTEENKPAVLVSAIGEGAPFRLTAGIRVACHLAGATAQPGPVVIEIELLTKEVGPVKATFKDVLKG